MYEAHITIDAAYAERVKGLYFRDWKFSQIDGDPILGPGSKAYLTAYNVNSLDLFNYMRDVVEELEKLGITVLRTKIERIVWDSKTGVNEL